MKMSPLSCAIFVGLFCAIYAYPVDDDDVIILPDFGTNAFTMEPSNKTGNLVAMWNPSMLMNPEEMGEYFEGDMMFKPSMTKTGAVATTYRWPNGIVPIAVEARFTFSEALLIIRAINEIQARTCIRFVTRTTQANYVKITNAPSGCWSYIGRIGGAQNVNLQSPGCVTLVGTPIHEFMHAIGIVHEQSSPNRDAFVRINFQNILAGTEGNFAKYTTAQVSQFNQPYDYGSVMHYSSHAFSKNGQPTIVPLQAGVTIGQRNGMSATDVATIRAMYGC